MKGLLVFLMSAAAIPAVLAQGIPSPGEMSHSESPPPSTTDSSAAPATPTPATPTPRSERNSAATQKAIDHLTRANQELLDLLKQQQSVLQDIQYDRRLQNRQITLLEQRLEDTLQANAALEAKEAKLEEKIADAKAATPAPEATTPAPFTNAPAAAAPTVASAPQPPPRPVSSLPAEQADGAPGSLWWHRVVMLSGEDSKDTDTFHITGKPWRVLWHNQDRPGDAYKNTSALFISAFPKNGALPKKVCSQLGTGGDITELTGTGDFYLKVEASGGRWELAVEDFR